MRVSRERILQLDIKGFVKRCEYFRENCVKLHLYDNADRLRRTYWENIEWTEADNFIEEEYFAAGELRTIDLKNEENAAKLRGYFAARKQCEEIEWVLFEVARRLGLYLGRNEWEDYTAAPLSISGEELSRKFAEMNGIKRKEDLQIVVNGGYVGQLWRAFNNAKWQKCWEQERRGLFDAAADEMEIQRLERKPFPVAYLITQGKIYGELLAGANDWAEVVEQLAELEYYKELVQNVDILDKMEAADERELKQKAQQKERVPFERLFAEWYAAGKFDHLNGDSIGIAKYFSNAVGCKFSTAKNYWSRREELKERYI